MTKLLLITSAVIAAVGCTPAPSQISSNAAPSDRTNSQTIATHSLENKSLQTANQTTVPKSDAPSKWTQGGTAIDTTTYDTNIAKADKELKAKPKDGGATKKLAEAYVERAVALTDARQYASALGDYRRAAKLDPENEEAKKWIDQITQIYQSMNREAPKEGEEPPALPLKKESEATKSVS
jgi:tetratricopeptide (TPR) repeat protein